MPSGSTSKPVFRRSRRRRCGGDSDRSWCRDLLLFDFLPFTKDFVNRRGPCDEGEATRADPWTLSKSTREGGGGARGGQESADALVAIAGPRPVSVPARQRVRLSMLHNTQNRGDAATCKDGLHVLDRGMVPPTCGSCDPARTTQQPPVSAFDRPTEAMRHSTGADQVACSGAHIVRHRSGLPTPLATVSTRA